MYFDFLIDLVFPPRCVHCNTYTPRGVAACDACLKTVSLNQTLFCPVCGTRLAENRKICHQDSPYLLGAVGNYGNEVLRYLIHNLKFRYIRDAAKPLGDFLVRYTESLHLPFENYIVIPIPLSKVRERERGFNQSRLIAEPFARHFEIPFVANALARAKNTRPQSEVRGVAERHKNMQNCFIVRAPELVERQNIVLIDDVSTSGATFLEAATTLKTAGARKIIALATAKA